MLRDDVYKYTKLTGEDGWHVPIMKVGAYLDGYDKGLEVLDKIEEEINSPNRGTCDYFIVDRIEEIINKYKAESEGYMKIEFIKDFAKNWKAGEIVEAKYVGMGEILVDNVATVDAEQLLKHCKIVSESEE